MAADRPSPIWPLTLLALALLLIGTFLYVFRTLSRVPAGALEEGRAAVRQLQKVAEAFRTGTVTTSFISYATEVEGVSRLQFATLREVELFERSDEARLLWDRLQLPTLVVRARAPVEYTYYLDLTEQWDFERDGRRVRVTAPPIRFNRPAVDASELEFEVRAGSLFRDEAAALERLKSGITEMSLRRAEENVDLVRELGRREVAEFVRGWLAGRFLDGAEHEIVVVFRDELEIQRVGER